MLVGEQPGDQEDLQGRPFVGPAGKILDRALTEAGLDRRKLFVTNAVKHFKFEQRGKRRLHSRPNAGEIRHYQWWLDKEIELVRPRVLVAMGATAVLALSGKPLPIARNRGQAMLHGLPGVITIHPSYLLRLRDPEDRAAGFAGFVADLKTAGRLCRTKARRGRGEKSPPAKTRKPTARTKTTNNKRARVKSRAA
jgi:DNA polymerase